MNAQSTIVRIEIRRLDRIETTWVNPSGNS